MTMMLLDDFREVEEEARAFAAEYVEPYARRIDREERIPGEVISSLASSGRLATGLPVEPNRGGDRDPVAACVAQGLLHEALGMASSSVQGLVNVHNMAGSAVARWGTRRQKEHWLPRLAVGDTLAAIALTEPNVGSDAAAVETTVTAEGDGHILMGTKRWITCGQVADLFVVLARSEAGPTAFLLPRSTRNLSIEPITGILGCRGYMLASLHLDGCRLPASHLLGRPGFGLSHVVATGLDAGRYNLAWGCVGLARACLDAAFSYSQERRQFGSPLSDFQLIQQKITRMMTEVHAARLMCWHAGCLRGPRDPAAIKESAMAKYYASTMVNRVAYDAVQIHGAHGCGPDYPLERYLRDARIMEVIEGSTQILEVAIARYGFQERSR